ncbi:MAG: tryptophan-rich sensory protein [archaeon]|jgi:tryptophan-rich sensory protein|nr:tryptophan-rich sensory protein [archaeon]
MKEKKNGVNWKVLVLSFVSVHIAAFIGSRFTDTGEWYESVKPSITPPGFVFPIVWTILFILISIALYLAYVSSRGAEKRAVVIMFGLNIVLNALWSYLFFGLHNPIAAFIELVVLWINILIITLISWRVNRTAGYLLLPYLIWVSFAGILNYIIAFA